MTIKLTREEAIQDLEAIKSFERVARGRLALDMAIEALKRERTDEWCTDCKEYDTEKKCCPRFNKVIREAMKRVPHEDGTLEVKVEDATKIGRVLITDDKHRGGLYYPDEDEPQGDLISRAEAIDALRYAQHRFTVADEAGGMGSVKWSEDVIYFAAAERVLTELPSADRPTDGDLISRADAIKAARHAWSKDLHPTQFIEALPPASRPKGEWIETAQDYYEMVNKKGGGVNEDTEYFTDDIACPNCLAKFSNIDNETERFNFCPNCGADMRGENK